MAIRSFALATLRILASWLPVSVVSPSSSVRLAILFDCDASDHHKTKCTGMEQWSRSLGAIILWQASAKVHDIRIVYTRQVVEEKVHQRG
ncbi:MAG: hypothetical protein J3Q66DRAFT_360597 [Benniella sp.]|nr:MAG: hypothetical protein J3Q66DRAFT_360597 [Benniella sp.]